MTFGTAVNCMDGRVQLSVIAYLKQRFQVEYIDMITEAGPNGILAKGEDKMVIQSIFNRVRISLDCHNSSGIAIVGHYDCAGNPIAEEGQLEDLHKAAQVLKGQYPHIQVIKLWVNEHWQVREIE